MLDKKTLQKPGGRLPGDNGVQAVAIDMTTACELEIRAHCPQAEIVYDLFHLIAKYSDRPGPGRRGQPTRH